MKNLATLLLIFISLQSIQAQRFGSIYTAGYWTIKDVKSDIDKQIEIGIKNENIAFSDSTFHKDTLIYHVSHKTDAFTLKATFNYKIEAEDDETYCDYEEYIFDCTPCSQKHIDYFLANNFNFRKTGENKYLSNYKWHTEMEIIYKSSNKDCVSVVFRHIDKPKDEYTRYYKSLKKNK